MRVTMSVAHFKTIKWKINVKSYVLFSMFSAPFIDLLNGYFEGLFPIGQVIRSFIIFANVYLCLKCVPKTEKKSTYIFLFTVIYMVIHSLITGMVSSNGGIIENLSFGLKLSLFLSEMQLIINYSKIGIIEEKDVVCFWKFSCWFVPISLLLCKVLNIDYYLSESKAGLYSSVNAMSIIFIIQFILCIYFAREKKTYWIAILLNIIAVELLGTKSPYLYILAVVMSLVLFYSKNRIKIIAVIVLSLALSYVVLSNFFLSDMQQFIGYQTKYLQKALDTSTICDYLLSGRNNMLVLTWKSLSDGGLSSLALLFGIGRTNFASGIEMDFFEILFAFGIPVTIGVYCLVLRSFSWKCRDKTENLFLNIALICIISFGTLGGHTFLEAISATYSAILTGYKYSCCLAGGGVKFETKR